MDDDRQDLPSEPVGQEPSQGPVPPPPYGPPAVAPPRYEARTAPVEPPKKKRSLWRIVWGIVTFLSVAANVILLVLLIGIIAVFATGSLRGAYQE